MTNIRVTQATLTVFTPQSVPQLRVTEFYSQVLHDLPPAVPRVSRLEAEVASGHPLATPRVSQLYLQLLATRSPNYEFIVMVLPDVFPNDISYNSVGSTRFATDVLVVDSGDDQRVGRWDAPLMEYDVAYGIRTMEQLLKLIQFFRAMRGRLYAFCYQDNVDFTSSIPVAYEARAAPAITPHDQVLGIGDGLTYQFQLVKVYSSATQTQVRTITRPQPGTTLIAINGAPTTNFTVDETLGIVTFTSPLTKTFADPLSKDGTDGTLIGAAHDFDVFRPYVGFNCMLTGWASGTNNSPITRDVVIGAISSDGSQMGLGYPSGYGNVAESNVTGITVTVHPAPLTGQTVTAGFLFYVPCRFDTDILPVTIEDYGVGGSNSVKLIEVRSSDPN